MKTFAIHLPQFHTFPENARWWRKGFTEWTNVKKAKPLYEGHSQPLIPINSHYYNLSNPEEMTRQHRLAAQYGIDGFVYYHYWFNGKKLMEKPVEDLLTNKEAKQQYCLCWANEPWTRAWDGKNKEILMPQTFGGQEDWLNHIRYLISFFKDERYLRIQGRPVFFVYSPKNIPNFDNMIEFWDSYLERCGEEKIYLIEYISSFNPKAFSDYSKAVFEFEPLYSAHYEISFLKQADRFIDKKMKRLDCLDYDYLWNRILNKQRKYGTRQIVRSAFTNFDNSPRKGTRAFITQGASYTKFADYLNQLIHSNRQDYMDFTVINAWNEWGEGAILEPTESDQYGWLQAVKDAVQ